MTKRPKSISATNEEWAGMKEAAKAAGVSVSTYVLDLHRKAVQPGAADGKLEELVVALAGTVHEVSRKIDAMADGLAKES